MGRRSRGSRIRRGISCRCWKRPSGSLGFRAVVDPHSEIGNEWTSTFEALAKSGVAFIPEETCGRGLKRTSRNSLSGLGAPVWFRYLARIEPSLVQDSRYKDGTTKNRSIVFSVVPYRALQSDRCLVITFTAVTRVQIPSGTPSLFRSLRAIAEIFVGTKRHNSKWIPAIISAESPVFPLVCCVFS